MPNEAELLIEWQKRLGLTDWTIELETNCDPKDMDLEDCDGCSTYLEVRKIAKIQIVNPESRTFDFFPFDFEMILVHELMHLKTCMLERGTDWDKLQLRTLHVLVNDIARALVETKRSIKE